MELAYPVVAGALRPLLRHGMRWALEGEDHLPRSGPIIVAANHISYLDPLAIALVADRRGRRVRYLAKRELFDRAGLGTFLRAAGQIPVARGTADAAGALEDAVRALRDGQCVVVFPEGTISLDLEPMAGRTGTARLAALSGVPVVPLGIWGTHRTMTKGRPPRWRAGVATSVVLGPPVTVGHEEDLHAATDRIMDAVCACVRDARARYPQTPRSGEDPWWVRAPDTAVLRPSGGDQP